MTVSDYGEAMIIPSAGLLIGSVTVNRLHKYFSQARLLCIAFSLMVVAGIWLLMMPLSSFHLIGAFTLLTVAQGMSFPISMSMLLEPHPNRVGAVSALSGSIQMCIAGFFGEFLVRNFVASQSDLGIFYCCAAVVMMLVLLVSRRTQKETKVPVS